MPKPMMETRHFIRLARKDRESIVSLLVEKGADVNAKNIDGKTPLHKACEYGNEAIVSLLLEKGADVNAKKQLWMDATSLG